jgi:cadmium resistance protein CadD (predicted permease)
MDLLSLIGLGTASFVGTNLDDMLILLIFYSNHRFPTSHVVLGQYLGMGALIAVALVASLVSLVIPHNLLGLIGLIPMAFGIKELLELRKKEYEVEGVSEKISKSRWISYLPFLTVSAITFSGGEEIGVYTSVFATNSEAGEIITVVAVVMALTGLWCAIAYHLLSRPIVAKRIRRLACVGLPIVLIGLGMYILIEAFQVL